MVTLRTDLRQWLIYDDDAAYATADALDALAYRFTGAALSQHEDIELRAVGNFMLKVAEVREKRLSGEDATKIELAAITHIAAILQYMVGGPKPEEALSEVQAVVFAIDSKVNASGTRSTSAMAGLVRGDERGESDGG